MKHAFKMTTRARVRVVCPEKWNDVVHSYSIILLFLNQIVDTLGNGHFSFHVFTSPSHKCDPLLVVIQRDYHSTRHVLLPCISGIEMKPRVSVNCPYHSRCNFAELDAYRAFAMTAEDCQSLSGLTHLHG